MTFEQLKYFIAIVENGTYFNASESLHISQSNLSKQIIKLEKELNIDLFDRRLRSASLTDAGRLFYNDATILINQYNIALNNISNYKKFNDEKLHIGTLPIQTQYNLTSIFNEFKKDNPEINLTIDEVEDEKLLEGIKMDEYHIILARENMLNPKYYDIYPIAKDELVVVLPLGHKLSKYSQLNFNQLSGENFILMNPYTYIYQLCMNIIEEYNISANVVRTARTESIIGAVALNEGISLLPKKNIEIFHHKNLVTVPLNHNIELSVIAAKKKTRANTPALNKLIKFIENFSI
ncbi:MULTISPECIES: LysR family transcriptional regulator [Clostridium]|uniref:LysR family transcriptional regulator n=1 Tax=Clostridium TaxID=1485 RepID=UPI0005EBED4F|nr:MULTISPECIES: LysR family transcriptional regulator [Clostridium]OFS21474.1 LysR family transcriptional regulator [Clostridium sp. HMSC19A10]